MDYNNEKNYPLDKQPADTYDDGDIPKVDLPQDLFPETAPNKNIPAEMPPQMYPLEMPEDVIPDEVPRRDGPGGDGGETCEL